MSKCNEGIRIAASSADVRMWEIAAELGMADASLSRKMRNELSEKDKAKCFQIIDKLSARKAKSNFRLDFPKWHSSSEIPDEFHKEKLIDIDGTDISYYVSSWLLAKVKNPMDEKKLLPCRSIPQR